MNQSDQNASRNWWVLAILALLAYGLGAWGYYLSLQPKGGTIFDAAYRTFHLFRMKYEGFGPLPWQLELARFLAPVVTMTALGKIAFSFLREQWCAFRVKHWWSDHHVVIGACDAGRMLARDIAKTGHKVVFVSSAPEDFLDDALRRKNCAVLRRSSCDEATWSAVGLDRAATVTLIADDDEFNLDAIRQARDCSANRPADFGQLQAYCRFTDHRIRQLLRDCTNFFVSLPQIAVSAFNPYQRAARLILKNYPVEGERWRDDCQPHVLLTGSGPMAENLIFWIAMTCHFAQDRKARITLVDQDASTYFARLCRKFQGLENVVEANPIDDDPENPDKASFSAVAAGGRVTCAYYCGPSGSANLATANRWAPLLGSSQSVVTFERHGQLAELVQIQTEARQAGANSFIFEIFGESCTHDGIVQAKLDLFARYVADLYFHQATTEWGMARGATPAVYPWAELSEEWRDANRTQIDHVGIKLRTIGAIEVNLDEADPGFAFTDDEIETLARMEHARWVAQRLLYGWKYAEKRDDKARLHPNMLGWEELDEATREKDRVTVRSIPDQLKLVNRGIRRLNTTAPVQI